MLEKDIQENEEAITNIEDVCSNYFAWFEVISGFLVNCTKIECCQALT